MRCYSFALDCGRSTRNDAVTKTIGHNSVELLIDSAYQSWLPQSILELGVMWCWSLYFPDVFRDLLAFPCTNVRFPIWVCAQFILAAVAHRTTVRFVLCSEHLNCLRLRSAAFLEAWKRHTKWCSNKDHRTQECRIVDWFCLPKLTATKLIGTWSHVMLDACVFLMSVDTS